MFADYFSSYERFLSLGNLVLRSYTDSKFELRESMKRTKALLEELGSPEKKLSIIHVAGTSGKGSVVNALHEILLADGRAVASYTSPHTTSYLERFRVAEHLIDPELLTGCMNDVYEAYQKRLTQGSSEMSFFELSTVLAMYSFVKAKTTWCVLETGCGGRWDATNVIPAPKVAVITNIDRDHVEILGNSLTKIAYEKAGIIKSGSTVFCGETRPNIRKVFMKEAVEKGTALFFVNPPSAKKVRDELGMHQQHNAALAEAAAHEVGVAPETIQKALASTRPLPCRFEIMQSSPSIILDGAHNPAKIKTTVALLKKHHGPAHVIFGCTATKEADAMLKLLVPVAKTITTTRFHTEFRKAMNPAALLAAVPKAKRAGAFLDHSEALAHVKKIAGKQPILVTGSLYLAGEMRGAWISEESILKTRSSFPS